MKYIEENFKKIMGNQIPKDELENEPIKRKTLNRNNNYMENIYEYK